jgi:hypothetical protein
MNNAVLIVDLLAILGYLYVGNWVGGKLYDLYHSPEKPSWLTLFLIWPVATISDRRNNVKNGDPRFEDAPYQDCYAGLLANRTTRASYIFLMTFFWGLKVVCNLSVFVLVIFVFGMKPIGTGLALGIANLVKMIVGDN